MGVSHTGENFDYGFALKETCIDEHEEHNDPKENLYPDEAFLLFNQVHWEDDIIFDSDELVSEVKEKIENASELFDVSRKNNLYNPRKVEPDTSNSLFHAENQEMVDTCRWEDDIIFDAENMDKIPTPIICTLDPNDENYIMEIPDDILPYKSPEKVKCINPKYKTSKNLLAKAALLTNAEECLPSTYKDPYNLSNDEYYLPKVVEHNKMIVYDLLQHSIPVLELQAPFVPTQMNEHQIRKIHRPRLERFFNGPLSQLGPHPVLPITNYKLTKVLEQKMEESKSADVYFMETIEDLTGKYGDLIMVELSEEFPPLVSMVGMCSKIKNYYMKKTDDDRGPSHYKFGETSYVQTSPFLGLMQKGESIQAIESNMARAPIYEHPMPISDFLVIRTAKGYSCREVQKVYCSGQQCPLLEVPKPNSRRARKISATFIQVFIYRLFWKSSDNPRQIKMDDIRKSFPIPSEYIIKMILQKCANLIKTSSCRNLWVLKPNFRLPAEDELREMVTPEQWCSIFSMLEGQQRLNDAGYSENDNDLYSQKLEDEVLGAPWNTTRAYMEAVKGKCLLELSGPADPTGCGEGFSYVRVNRLHKRGEKELHPEKGIQGTVQDLRKLSLKDAKNMLRKFGISEEEINKLSRWQVIDVVRTMSNEKTKCDGEEDDKFSRNGKFSVAGNLERYKSECQRLCDLQNRILSSSEVLSTDEDSSEDESDFDLEEEGKNIENIILNKTTFEQITIDRNERERKALRENFVMDKNKKKKSEKINEKSISSFGEPGRVLNITRTVKGADGNLYVKTERVRNPAIIDSYLKAKAEDGNFISNFDEESKNAAINAKRDHKNAMERERRRLKKIGHTPLKNNMTSTKFNNSKRNAVLNASSQNLTPTVAATTDSLVELPKANYLGTIHFNDKNIVAQSGALQDKQMNNYEEQKNRTINEKRERKNAMERERRRVKKLGLEPPKKSITSTICNNSRQNPILNISNQKPTRTQATTTGSSVELPRTKYFEKIYGNVAQPGTSQDMETNTFDKENYLNGKIVRIAAKKRPYEYRKTYKIPRMEKPHPYVMLEI